MVSRWTHRRRRNRRRDRDVNLREAVWALVRRQIPPAELRIIRLREHWADVAGPTLAKRAYPAEIHGGTLTVHVENDQWRHELEYLRPALMARLSQTDRGLHTLRVRRGPMGAIGDLDAEAAAAAPPDPPKPVWVGLSDEPPRETFDALMAVNDPDLRNSLAETRMMLAHRNDPSNTSPVSPNATDDDAAP